MFLWCHVRHINPVEEHPGRIKKLIKELLVILIMKELSFLCKRKILTRSNYIDVFGYENELVYPIFISKQTFEDSIDLLLLTEDD